MTAAPLHIAGERLMLDPAGAAFWPGQSLLAVADLHLEKGSAYAARGQMLPPYDTRETLSRLGREVAALAPRRVIFLGDTLHDGRAETRIAPEDAGALSDLAAGLDLVWVVGNHDADGPVNLPGRCVQTVEIDTLILRHEPQSGAQPGEVAGHLHPCAKVKGRGRSVRRRCFATDGTRLVLPAFGAYAGGLNIKDAAFRPLFAKPPLAGVLGTDMVHLIDWGQLLADG
jgi:DNA ligase-associated metallophosphoesterase